jgi:membrane protein
MQADPWQVQEVLDTLVQLDWVGRLSENNSQRYVLLIDLASTQAAPLIDHLLLADTPHSQAVWARWKDWRLAELV